MEEEVVDVNHPHMARKWLSKIDVYVATDDVRGVTNAMLNLFSSMGVSRPSFYSMTMSHPVNDREYKRALLLLTD
jgi:hypothetical protein